MKKTLTLLLILLYCIPSFAQNRASVKVCLKDYDTSEAVGFATVSITKKGDSKALKYSLSDKDGNASITGIPAGSYTVKAELLGYEPWSKEIILKNSVVDLGEVKMSQSKEELNAASVSAVGKAVEFKQDTIVYNASSYLMGENDLLEDLLKKLPGVEVSEEGGITVNGQAVNKVTIEGKTFFLNDPTMATRNILAKYVKKIKVLEKKSEQAEFSGIDDGERETVIDISVHESMMKGMFGNINGGVGHDIPASGTAASTLGTYDDWRYQGSAFIGKFTSKKQLSLVLNGNNINDRGGNRGSTGNGITTTYSAGVNGAWDLLDDAMKLGGSYNFGYSDKESLSKSKRISYRQDGNNLHYDNQSGSNNKSYNHSIGVRLEHKFSENSQLTFENSLSFSNGNSSRSSVYNTDTDFGGNLVATNRGFSSTTGDSKGVSTSGRLLFKQRLGIPGRTISLSSNYSLSHSESNGYNQSLTRTYIDGDIEQYSDSLINQRNEQHSNGKGISGRLSYTEPIGGGFYFEGNYSISYNSNKSAKDTYDSGPFDPVLFEMDKRFVQEGEVYNPTYSNNIINEHVNQSVGANFMYQKDKIKVQVGANLNPTHTWNSTTRAGVENTYESKVLNWAPMVSFSWDQNRDNRLRFRYSGRSSQPSTSQLMPVPNNSNPTNVSFGNPYLLPYFSHGSNVEFRRNNRSTFTSYNFKLDGNMVQNPIVSAIWYGKGGSQYSMPVNGANSYSTSFSSMVNSPIAQSNFSIMNNFSASYGENSSYIGNNIDTDKFYKDGEFDYELFHQCYPDIDKSSDFDKNKTQSASFSESLRVTWRLDRFEFRVGGSTRFNKTWYTITSNNPQTWNNSLNASATWNWQLTGLGINSSFNYKWYNGYTSGMEPEYVWNAEITKLLCKNKLTLSLRANDILGQEKALSITDNSNQYRETISNTLGRYVMLSVTFRFGKQQRGRGGFRGGMGGPGGGFGGGRP